MAALAGIDGADGNPVQFEIMLQADHDHIHFKLKSLLVATQDGRHHPPGEQAIARLVIAYVLSQRPGKEPGPQRVCEPTHGRRVERVSLPRLNNQYVEVELEMTGDVELYGYEVEQSR